MMNRDICAQIDARLVEIFDKIPDAANKTPEEFFSEVFSTEAVSHERLRKNTQGRSFVNNIIASPIPEADAMLSAIINLSISKERSYLDKLINSAANIVVDACKSGRYQERIPLVLITGSGRGRLTQVDHNGNLLIFGATSQDLPRLKEFFKTWRSVGKEKSLVDYCIEEERNAGKRGKFNSNVWNMLSEIFPEKECNPNTARAAYNFGGVDRLVKVLETSTGRQSLTEVDANGKLKIFGSDYQFLYHSVRFEIDGLDVIDLEGFFRRWRAEGKDGHESLLDYCIDAATRQENPVKFHPSVWHLLRRVFIAKYAEIDLGYDADEAREWYPGDSVNDESVERLQTFTEDSVEMKESDFGTTEGQLKAFALDENGKTPLQLAAERDDHELVRRIVDGKVSGEAIYINSADLLKNAGEKSVSTLVDKLQRFISHEMKSNGYNTVSTFLTGANPNLLRAIVHYFGFRIMDNDCDKLIREGCFNILKILIEKPEFKEKVLAKILERMNDGNINLKLFKFVKENYTGADWEKFVAVQTSNKVTPFHLAAKLGDVEVIRDMYATTAGKKAAKVISGTGATPLVFAIRGKKQNLAAIEELLSYPEVQETLESTDSNKSNIFHPDGAAAIDPEVLRLILRRFPRLVKLLDQRNLSGDIPLLSFTNEHFQILAELAREIEGFALPSGCVPLLVRSLVECSNIGLMPIITASAEGRAALGNFYVQEVLPLRRAINAGNLDVVKALLSCDEVKNTMLRRSSNGETIFHPLYYQNSHIEPGILSYILEKHPESKQLLLPTECVVSPLQNFNFVQLRIAFSYLSREELETLLLSTKGPQRNFVQAVLMNDSCGAAEYVLEEMDKCSDDLDAKKAVFTSLSWKDNRRFIDTLHESAKNKIPKKFLTLELEDGVLATLVGLIKCAGTEEQAMAVLNNPDENGLSLRQRVSPEQRAVLDSAFIASPALNSALGATSVAPALTIEHAGSTSLQSASSTSAVVSVPSATMQLRKRSSAEELRDDVKSHRIGE